MFFFFSNSIPVMQIYFTSIICWEKFLRESKFENFLHELPINILKSVQNFWPWLKVFWTGVTGYGKVWNNFVKIFLISIETFRIKSRTCKE